MDIGPAIKVLLDYGGVWAAACVILGVAVVLLFRALRDSFDQRIKDQAAWQTSSEESSKTRIEEAGRMATVQANGAATTLTLIASVDANTRASSELTRAFSTLSETVRLSGQNERERGDRIERRQEDILRRLEGIAAGAGPR